MHTYSPEHSCVCVCVFVHIYVFYHIYRWCVFLQRIYCLQELAHGEGAGGVPGGQSVDRSPLDVTRGVTVLTAVIFSCVLLLIFICPHPFYRCVAFCPVVNWLQFLPQKC